MQLFSAEAKTFSKKNSFPQENIKKTPLNYSMISFRLTRRAKEVVGVKLSMAVGRSQNTGVFYWGGGVVM